MVRMATRDDEAKVDPRGALALMRDEGFTYVDVRTADEFVEGRPAGAINVPLDDRFVTAMGERFARDAPIVVGCASGKRSARAAALLGAAGFVRVRDQRAGWAGRRGTFGEVLEPGWLREGLPIESG